MTPLEKKLQELRNCKKHNAGRASRMKRIAAKCQKDADNGVENAAKHAEFWTRQSEKFSN